jgi:hypothetical protein
VVSEEALNLEVRLVLQHGGPVYLQQQVFLGVSTRREVRFVDLNTAVLYQLAESHGSVLFKVTDASNFAPLSCRTLRRASSSAAEDYPVALIIIAI